MTTLDQLHRRCDRSAFCADVSVRKLHLRNCIWKLMFTVWRSRKKLSILFNYFLHWHGPGSDVCDFCIFAVRVAGIYKIRNLNFNSFSYMVNTCQRILVFLTIILKNEEREVYQNAFMHLGYRYTKRRPSTKQHSIVLTILLAV